jgi:hypothetical protein
MERLIPYDPSHMELTLSREQWFNSKLRTLCQDLFIYVYFRAIKLERKPLMQQGSPKRNPESKAAFESNQKMAILEFARISKSQVFPSLVAVTYILFA